MRAPIETKVALPAIVTGLLGAGGGAVYAVLLAYDVVAPDAEESAALAGLGGFILYAVQTGVGYWAPHTMRGDEAATAAVGRKRVHLHSRDEQPKDQPSPSQGQGEPGAYLG